MASMVEPARAAFEAAWAFSKDSIVDMLGPFYYPFIIFYIIVAFLDLVFTVVTAVENGPRSIPLIPTIFVDDGILICCFPLVAFLHVLVFPFILILTCFIWAVLWAVPRAEMLLLTAVKWFLTAPTYCGISRRTWKQWAMRLGLNRVAAWICRWWGDNVKPERAVVQQEQESVSSDGKVGYQLISNMGVDGASTVSEPPPYEGKKTV